MRNKFLVIFSMIGLIFMSGCSLFSQEQSGSVNEETGLAQEEPTNENSENTNRDESESNHEGEEEVQFEGISFLLPTYGEHFKLKNVTDPSMGYYLNKEKGVNFTLLVETLSTSISLDSYVNASIDPTQYTSITSYKYDDLEWAELIMKNNGIVLNQRALIHDHKAYVFSFGAFEEDYEEWIKVFNDVINSVKPL